MSGISRSKKNQFYLILVFWTVFLLSTSAALRFPHWKIDVLNILNFHFFFLILVISFIIFLNEPHYPLIYLNLSVFALFYLSGFLVLFVGKEYTLGDNYWLYRLWTYRKILISSFTAHSVLYILVSYLRRKSYQKLMFCFSFLLIALVICLIFRDFIFDFRHFLREPSQYQLLEKMNYVNLFSISLIIIYAILFIIKNAHFSGYVNLILVILLIFLSLDILDNNRQIINKASDSFSQYSLFINLLVFLLILKNKLLSLHDSFAKFYESMAESESITDLKVERRINLSDSFILKLKEYFQSRENRVKATLLILIFFVLFIVFFPSGFLKENLLVIFLLIILIVGYMYFLVTRRMKDKELKFNKKVKKEENNNMENSKK